MPTLTLMLARFALGSGLLWLALAVRSRRALVVPRAARNPASLAPARAGGRGQGAVGQAGRVLVGPVPARRCWTVVLLGAVCVTGQAQLFYGALERLDASLLALLFYTYPTWVTLAAVALGRERLGGRVALALGLSSAGLLVVLGAATGGGGVDAVGALMGLGAAALYTVYVLCADAESLAMPGLLLAALVTAGAALGFGLVALVVGLPEADVATEGWLLAALLGVVGTALPIAVFLAGLKRVGPSTASVLSTFEPIVTVALAFLVFGELLTPLQLAGATLVLAAAVLLAAPARAGAPARGRGA